MIQNTSVLRDCVNLLCLDPHVHPYKCTSKAFPYWLVIIQSIKRQDNVVHTCSDCSYSAPAHSVLHSRVNSLRVYQHCSSSCCRFKYRRQRHLAAVLRGGSGSNGRCGAAQRQGGYEVWSRHGGGAKWRRWVSHCRTDHAACAVLAWKRRRLTKSALFGHNLKLERGWTRNSELAHGEAVHSQTELVFLRLLVELDVLFGRIQPPSAET